MSKIIEVDTDGVLANMDGSYDPYVKDLVPDYSEEKYVDTWGQGALYSVCPEACARIRQLYKDPTFIRGLPRFDKVETAMNLLTQIPDCETVVHTHILTDEAADARREWLEELMIDSDSNFDIDISVGNQKKVLPDPFVTIEDNIDNLNASNADIKILIRRCHNRSFSLDDIEGGKQKYIVDSFFDAVMLLETILDN